MANDVAAGIKPGEAAVTPEATCARYLELVVLALVLIGLLMAYSANAPYAVRTGDLAATWRGFNMHAIKLAVASLFFVVGARVPLGVYQKYDRWILAAAALMLLAVLSPSLGSERHGARRWFQFGPLTFQPVEFAKLGVVIMVASSLDRLGTGVTNVKRCGLLVGVVLIPVCGLLFKQPDFGSACLVAGVVLLLVIFAGAKPSHYIPAMVLSIGGLILMAWCFMPHVLDRFATHSNPQPGDQAYQSVVAMGTGGLFGYEGGLGGGMAKLGYLPMVSNDFIFAAIGEEMGFVGTSLVVFLFVMFTILAARIVLGQRSMYRFLLGAGITISLVVQVLINLLVVTAVTPTKGIALPFISAGGSGLAMSLFAVGLLVNMAKSLGREPESEPKERQPEWLGMRDLLVNVVGDEQPRERRDPSLAGQSSLR